MNKITNQA